MPQPLIRWNQWPEDTPPLAGQEPAGVSIVVPHYRQLAELRRTLVGLANQQYPAPRLQVVVADDGSPDPPTVRSLGDFPFDLQVVEQEHDGFGLARARNLGAQTAEGEFLIFLDADMLPAPALVGAHATRLAVADYVVSIGHRRHVDMSRRSAEELSRWLEGGGSIEQFFGPSRATEPAWRREHLRRWDDLRSEHAEGYRLASGGNLAVHRDFYWDVGGSDPGFRQWGGEDLEFAYRATQRGAIFTYSHEALAWHQGPEAVTGPDERRSQEQQRPLLANRIASRYLRQGLGPRLFEVPHVAVGIDWSAGPHDGMQRVIDELLGHPWGADVTVFGVEDEHDFTLLSRAYHSDPRVEISRDGDSSQLVTDERPVPIRGAIRRPFEHAAAAVLSAVADIEDPLRAPRVAIIEGRSDGESGARPMIVWSAAAVSRTRRCHRGSTDPESVLETTANVFGRRYLDVDSVEGGRAGGSVAAGGDDIDEFNEKLRQWFWGLSPRARRALALLVSGFLGLRRLIRRS